MLDGENIFSLLSLVSARKSINQRQTIPGAQRRPTAIHIPHFSKDFSVGNKIKMKFKTSKKLGSVSVKLTLEKAGTLDTTF